MQLEMVHNYVLLHKFKLAGEQLKLIVGWPGTWQNFGGMMEFLEAWTTEC